jgi:hypothetical protein
MTEFLDDFVPSSSVWVNKDDVIQKPFDTSDLKNPGFFGLIMHGLANVVSLGQVALIACFREMIMSMYDGALEPPPLANVPLVPNPVPITPVFKDMVEWRLLWDTVFKEKQTMLRLFNLPSAKRTQFTDGLTRWRAFEREWPLEPVFSKYVRQDKDPEKSKSSYPQLENEVSIDFDKYNMLNFRGTITPLDEDFLVETRMPQLRFLNIMSIYHHKYMPNEGAEAKRNANRTETAISEAEHSMAQLASNSLVFAQANVFDLIKKLFIPSQTWEMQAKLTGRVKLSSTFIAAMARAESTLKYCLPDLYGSVPLEALTCETNYVVDSPAAKLFLSDFTDLISYTRQQIDLDFGQRYNTVQQHNRPPLVLQDVAARLRSYRFNPAGANRWQIVKMS